MPVNLEHLGRALKQAQHRDHRTMDTALLSVGISLVQWDALRAVDENPGATAHDLAVVTFQSDQAFGTLAGRLVAAGWIERRPGEGRRLHHHLTDAGERMIVAGRTRATDVLRQLFDPLDEAERAALSALLGKLLA